MESRGHSIELGLAVQSFLAMESFHILVDILEVSMVDLANISSPDDGRPIESALRLSRMYGFIQCHGYHQGRGGNFNHN